MFAMESVLQVIIKSSYIATNIIMMVRTRLHLT